MQETNKPIVHLTEEDLIAAGYQIGEDPDQPGMFYFSRNGEGSDLSYGTKEAAIEAASDNAKAIFSLSECQNCGKIHTEENLADIKDYHQRVAPGEPAPTGECPDCGCLCQPFE